MKGIYLAAKNLEICKKTEFGIYTKILAQYACLSRYYEMELLSESWKRSLWRKLLARLPFMPSDFGLPLQLAEKRTDFVFFRLDLGDRQTIRFLRKIRKHNPRCKIIVEIPTYPLAWKSLKWYTKLIRPKHRYCEDRLHLYADAIAMYQCLDSLYGLPVIGMSNGLDMANNPLRTIKPGDDDSINIISVSSMSVSHGIDRLVAGLHAYYAAGGSRSVTLHVVGAGAEYNSLVSMAQEYGLRGRVLFYGYQTGSALAAIYDKCDIGLECLGSHRNDQRFSSTIKSREYWAKGLPVISECEFPPEVAEIAAYMFRVPEDETAVDIPGLIAFYDSIYQGGRFAQKSRVAADLHRFAEKYYAMDVAMRPVLDYIGGADVNSAQPPKTAGSN